jgi:hypothetical protein
MTSMAKGDCGAAQVVANTTRQIISGVRERL